MQDKDCLLHVSTRRLVAVHTGSYVVTG